MCRLLTSFFLSIALGSAAACGQEVPYHGLRAGQDVHEIAEAQRQQRLNDQLYLNDAMRARYGWVPSGSVVWYANAGFAYGPPVGTD